MLSYPQGALHEEAKTNRLVFDPAAPVKRVPDVKISIPIVIGSIAV